MPSELDDMNPTELLAFSAPLLARVERLPHGDAQKAKFLQAAHQVGQGAGDGAAREELELRAILLVLVGPIDCARGHSDAGQHGQSQKCSENYLHDGIQYANNTTLSRLATDHASIA